MNPIVSNVMEAFNAVPTHGTSIGIDRTGVVLPKGQHFQGIQRMLGAPSGKHGARMPLLVITSSSDQQGYLVMCELSENEAVGRAFTPVIMGNSPLRHTGGCQAVGNYLVAGLEDNQTNQVSEVQFWDFNRFPTKITPMTLSRSGPPKVSTAGAVGMSSLGNGAVLAVGTFDSATIDFYRSDGDPFNGSPLTLRFTWESTLADRSSWLDQKYGSYQNLNLITEAGGQLYMVGFAQYGNDDYMDLFTVNADVLGDPNTALTKVAAQHMYCTDGCSFVYGGGVFIPSKDGFEVYAVNGHSGDYDTGTTIYANIFTPF